MAAGTLPHPGSHYGPCAQSCAHRDCAETRRMAAALCSICGYTIGYERLFYRDGEIMTHAVCAEDRADRERLIQTGFQQWIGEPARARSPEVDFGCWWSIGDPCGFPHWRVSWIKDTGELYAVEMYGHRPDRFVVLARFDGRAAVEAAMQGWAESETLRGLTDLIARFGGGPHANAKG